MEGYFAGVDGTNTTFYPCFHNRDPGDEVCLANGQGCDYGYTGIGCTSCTDDRVLVSAYSACTGRKI